MLITTLKGWARIVSYMDVSSWVRRAFFCSMVMVGLAAAAPLTPVLGTLAASFFAFLDNNLGSRLHLLIWLFDDKIIGFILNFRIVYFDVLGGVFVLGCSGFAWSWFEIFLWFDFSRRAFLSPSSPSILDLQLATILSQPRIFLFQILHMLLQ